MNSLLASILLLATSLLGSAQEFKPYDSVITKDAKSKDGVFKVHRVKEKLYYEIPKTELGKEFLWMSKIAKTTLGIGFGNQNLAQYIVRWDRRGDRVLLRSVSYGVVADPKLPIAGAVEAANNDTIVMAFPIETLGKDDAPVVDVTDLFATEVPEFSARAHLKARGFDPKRSFIERVAAFGSNIEVEATHTYTSPIDGPPPKREDSGELSGMRPGSATLLLHHSMVKLPERPMMPRLLDERVGYMASARMDYGQDTYRAPQRRYISRWRLEKKDPSAALSEPVKPIVIWVDPATPVKWVRYVKRGIENWRAAFEEAGFKDAIIAREAPTPEQDHDWSPEDARHTVVAWQPLMGPFAFAGPITDPRTGEILFSMIQVFHGIMSRMSGNYFVQVGPLDPRARKLPLPDDIIGSLIEYVVAHEVGHALGLPHNMKASSTYPADKVRDREWVKKMGYSPSIEDYSRFNYVAQPEDGIDPADLVPKVGPYDRWAICWGYKPIPGARTPEEEKSTLDQWAREQEKTPWFRYETTNARDSDPGALAESVGDADAVRSTTLGIKNLKRVMEMLVPATLDERWEYLDELYGRVIGQWTNEMLHVAAIVGGLESQEKHEVRDGVRFVPVSRERQKTAVQFLSEHAFLRPTFLIKPEILWRIEPSGELDRIKEAQVWVLRSLLSAARFARLAEQEAMRSPGAYAPLEFLGDVRKGIWSEIDSREVHIDAYRRNLQRAWLDLMAEGVNAREPGDEHPFVRGELSALKADIGRLLARPRSAEVMDLSTRLHLEDAQKRITNILDPKFQPPPAIPEPSSPTRFPLRYGMDFCWLE